MLLYNSPAKIWEETLPLGNGRIGMMPDGGVDNEHIVLNDISMWSGSEDSTALNPEAINYLPKIQELLLSLASPSSALHRGEPQASYH